MLDMLAFLKHYLWSARLLKIVIHIPIILSIILLFQSRPPVVASPQISSKVYTQTPSKYMSSMPKFEVKSQPHDMSPADFKIFNRLAVQMNFYHSILRESWDELYTGTAKGARKPTTSSMISLGLNFCDHLKGHHDIEESYWFPILGKRMEGFRGSGFAKEQHRAMHKGLDVLAPYLQECKRGERELRREEVREIMDSFGGILWTHLDEEVRELGAENMQKYWTKNEMRNFPF